MKLKLISWNCNKNFRNKYKVVEYFEPDIVIVPESESTEYLLEKAKPEFWDHFDKECHQWIGEKNPYHGLGVFTRNGFRVKRLNEYEPEYLLIDALSIFYKDTFCFNLFPVWAKKYCKNGDYGYIVNVIKAIRGYSNIINDKTIFAGDFNGGLAYEKNGQDYRNFNKFLLEMSKIDFKSGYHSTKNEKFGKEKLYTHKKKSSHKDFHIDYIWLHQKQIPNIHEFKIISFDEIKKIFGVSSDHSLIYMMIDF